MPSAKQILVVDDERRIGEVVEYALCKEGYRVVVAADGKRALELFAEQSFDLVVLDVMLPDIGGLEVCRQIRARGSVPVLFLSARGDEVDKVVGLELGGDDYLTKPFSPRELVARVRAVLRRVQAPNAKATPEVGPRVVGVGQLELDSERHEARYAGQRVALTATEFALLLALYDRPGVVLTRAQLMQRAYSGDLTVTERTLDTHVRRIRGKFRPFGFDPIATVHGVGYRAGVG
ncbi:MAG: response regulator transcription factor [Polyangiaceae bacterium]